MEHWSLTSHERAAITHSLKEMCGLENYERIGTHTGKLVRLGWKGTKRTLTGLFQASILVSWQTPDDRDISEGLSLLNIATGVVLQEQASDRLLDAIEMGKRSMEDFISTRINTNEVNFWDPLPKLKINTCSSAAKKTEVKTTRSLPLPQIESCLDDFLLLPSKEILTYEKYSATSFQLSLW